MRDSDGKKVSIKRMKQLTELAKKKSDWDNLYLVFGFKPVKTGKRGW
mgnify:CR=1 FL=1